MKHILIAIVASVFLSSCGEELYISERKQAPKTNYYVSDNPYNYSPDIVYNHGRGDGR